MSDDPCTIEGDEYRQIPKAMVRVRIRDVRFHGWRLRLHHVLAICLMLLAVAAIATYFMNWHVVHERSDSPFDNLICTFMVDCDPSSFADAGPLFTGEITYCSGWDHSGIRVPMIFILVIALVALAYMRPTFPIFMGTNIGVVLLCPVLVAKSLDLKHLFDTTTSLWAATAHEVFSYVLFALAAANILMGRWLYAGSALRKRNI